MESTEPDESLTATLYRYSVDDIAEALDDLGHDTAAATLRDSAQRARKRSQAEWLRSGRRSVKDQPGQSDHRQMSQGELG